MFLTQDEESGEITFYMKGADVVMHNVVQYNDWMDEEVSCFVLLLQFSCISFSCAVSLASYLERILIVFVVVCPTWLSS